MVDQNVFEFPAKQPRALSEHDIRAILRDSAGTLGLVIDKLPTFQMRDAEWLVVLSGVLAAHPYILDCVITRGLGISLRQAIGLSLAERIDTAAQILRLTAAVHHPFAIGLMLRDELLPTSRVLQEHNDHSPEAA